MGVVCSVCSSRKEEHVDVNIKDPVSVLKKIHAGMEGSGNFYERKKEVDGLITMLCHIPATITVISGPQDCGKSSTITRLQEIWEKAPLQAYSPFVVVDPRKNVCTTPDAFLCTLRSELLSWKKVALSLLAKSVTVVEPVLVGMILDSIKALEQKLVDKELINLATIRETLLDYANRLPGVRPVLVFNEANRIQAWEAGHKNELQELLWFMMDLVRSHKVHVVLTDSDGFVHQWLANLGHTALTPVPFGYFGENDAKGFVVTHLMKLAYSKFEEQLVAAWPDVYKHAGGCPVTLAWIMQNAKIVESLVDAVSWSRSCFRRSASAVLDDLDDHEKRLLEVLLQSGGVLPLPPVLDARAEAAVDQLVQKNVLHVRCWWSDGNWIEDMGSFTRSDEYMSYLMFAKPAEQEAFQTLLTAGAFTSKKRRKELVLI